MNFGVQNAMEQSYYVEAAYGLNKIFRISGFSDCRA